MFKSLLKLLPRRGNLAATGREAISQFTPPLQIEAPGVAAFDFATSLLKVHGLPTPEWSKVESWVASIPDSAAHAQAWADAELAWLAHLKVALGQRYDLCQNDQALVLSPLEPKVATATVEFMTKTLSRITRLLDGVAQAPDWGKDILLVFEDEDTYYRYISRYYPEDGEFAFSGGMHINFGCSHFATVQADLRAIEPVIVHEMTHGCLGHLTIPAWLNEGIAVNTERRLSPPTSERYTAQQLHWMHQRFWNETTIQEFWSGKSFLRPDEGNLLSYDLARILVERFSRDWGSFKPFVLEAQIADAGRDAAASRLGVDLGLVVTALFEFDKTNSWSPDPVRWDTEPERGAFRGNAYSWRR